MKPFFLLLLIIMSFIWHAGAQVFQDSVGVKKSLKYNEYCLDSSQKHRLIIFMIDRGSHTAFPVRNFNKQILPQPVETIPKRTPFLTVHGNVLYDVNYYSNIDTPYIQKDVYQHTVQAYLDITVKEHYPLRLYFTTRFSNSGLFKNFTDANMLYSSNMFSRGIKDRLKQKMLESFPFVNNLDSLKKALERKYSELDLLKKGQTDPGALQKMVEARERAVFKKRAKVLTLQQRVKDSASNKVASSGHDATDSGLLAKKGSLMEFYHNKQEQVNDIASKAGQVKSVIQSKKLPASSLNELLNKTEPDSSLQGKEDSVLSNYQHKKSHYDSLFAEVTQLQQKYNKLRELQANKSAVTAKEIDAIRNPQELQEKMRQLNISDAAMPKGYKTLMALRTVGIGTNIINYSELSVKNINVTGVQVEYNPSFYLAFAAGTVDYRFRDFIVRNNNQPKQYVGVVRAGFGMKDGNNLIFTYYAGRRQLYNYFTDTINQAIQTPSPYLMGFTIESNYKPNRNTTLTAELAKSSMPYYAADKPVGLLSGALKFNDHSNEAYSLKLVSFIPSTKTSFTGYYKRLGINFQSFSIFTNGSAQNAWNIWVNQPFFKRMLEVAASVNSNDFTNPYIPQGYKSSTVFKSIQATFRKNSWPVVSVGYFPSSQLTRLTDNRYIQNMFYTFTGNVSHYYQVRNNMFSTSLIYTQFYNRSADSNFVYFNTKNILLNQSFFLRLFTLQLNVSGAMNNYYKLYVADGNMQVKCNKWLSLGGGIKYNRQTEYNIEQVGYSGNVAIKIPVLGEFRLMADKGFIPGANRQLVSNNSGRFTYFKIF